MRFYKGAANGGLHVGHLWTGAGALLATTTFADETATGWQQASFPEPIPIAAGATHVVSYHAPSGTATPRTTGGLAFGSEIAQRVRCAAPAAARRRRQRASTANGAESGTFPVAHRGSRATTGSTGDRRCAATQ